MSDQPLPNARDGAGEEAVPRSMQREAQRDPPSHARATPLVDSMDGTPYSEQALRSALEALHRADDDDDDRTLHQPETPPRATGRNSGSATRAPVDSSTAIVDNLKLLRKSGDTGRGVVGHSTPAVGARKFRQTANAGSHITSIFHTPNTSPQKPQEAQNNADKNTYNYGAKNNVFDSTNILKDDNRLIASVSVGRSRKPKANGDDGAKTNHFPRHVSMFRNKDDNRVVARVSVGHVIRSKDKVDDGAKTNGIANHSIIFSDEGDGGAVTSVSVGHAPGSKDKDVDDAEINGFATTASIFSDKDGDGALTSVSAGHAHILSDKDRDVAETSGIAGYISISTQLVTGCE